MPTLAELEDIRANAFADDLEIEDEMLEWTESAARGLCALNQTHPLIHSLYLPPNLTHPPCPTATSSVL
jgi:hypothetical protein